MLPFCGYNMADYFGHWLKVGQKLRFDRAPRIFQVNWFRKGADGRFLWPGFGDNARVIDWIIRRIDGEVGAVDSPIGRLPRTEDLDLDGIEVPQADLDELFAIDTESWLREADLTEEFYQTFDGKVPAPLWAELAALRYRLKRGLTPHGSRTHRRRRRCVRRRQSDGRRQLGDRHPSFVGGGAQGVVVAQRLVGVRVRPPHDRFGGGIRLADVSDDLDRRRALRVRSREERGAGGDVRAERADIETLEFDGPLHVVELAKIEVAVVASAGIRGTGRTRPAGSSAARRRGSRCPYSSIPAAMRGGCDTLPYFTRTDSVASLTCRSRRSLSAPRHQVQVAASADASHSDDALHDVERLVLTEDQFDVDADRATDSARRASRATRPAPDRRASWWAGSR